MSIVLLTLGLLASCVLCLSAIRKDDAGWSAAYAGLASLYLVMLGLFLI